MKAETDCVFCKVLQDDVNKQIIAKSEHFTAIKKPYKSEEVNFLVISNHHVDNLLQTDEDGKEQISFDEMLKFVRRLANGKHWSIKISNGKNAGQDVFHFHAHINSFEKWDTWEVLKKSGQTGLKARQKVYHRTQTKTKMKQERDDYCDRNAHTTTMFLESSIK